MGWFVVRLPLVLTLFVFAPFAHALTIDENTTLTQSFTFQSDRRPIEVVDGQDPPTVLNILDGAHLFRHRVVVSVRNTSVVNVFGGTISSEEDVPIIARESSMVNVFDGVIVGDDAGISAFDASRVNVHGGQMDALVSFDSSEVNFSDGTILDEGLRSGGSSTVNIFGGTIGDEGLHAAESSTINIFGGDIRIARDPGGIHATDSSTVNIFGFDLELVDGVLTGTLADGNVLSHEVSTSANGRIILHTFLSLQAGDTDQDLNFDQRDLVQVQIAGKYLTGQAATWGEGDWDGAPGGEPGSPPPGNGLFDQIDVIAALGTGVYLTGPYAAVQPNGQPGDGQTSVMYNAGTGEVVVDAPDGIELTSINIDSAAGIFTGEPAQSIGGSFDNDADGNIFKATFGGSFGSVSFGNVAQGGLSEEFVLGDLTVVGSLAGGGDLGEVDLVYVPEPTSVLMLAVGLVIGLLHFRRASR